MDIKNIQEFNIYSQSQPIQKHNDIKLFRT